MGLLSKLYTFINGQYADANQVNSDFDQIYQLLNGGIDSLNAPTLGHTVTALSASVILNNNQCGIIECTAGAAGITVTLPSAVTAGLKYIIKKVDSAVGTVTINTTSSQTIDGATTKTLFNQYDEINVVSNGTNWDIVSRINKGEAWIAPTLLNSWVNLGADTPVGYFKDDLGIVHLKGAVTTGTAALIFTLPAGYRPLGTTIMNALVVRGGVYTSQRLDITATGNVSLNYTTEQTISFEGMTFRAQN